MRTIGVTMMLGILLAIGGGTASADSECVRDAKATRGECRAACDEDFVIARDLCRNIDPECAAGCRVALAECRAPIVTALEQCVDACRDQLNADRATCPKRGRGRDFCIDRANIRAFLCRDECRDELQVHQGLKACRHSFDACMQGCGEPTPAPPAPTAAKTEVPQPTAQPTEAPQPTGTPRPTRTATPQPEPTLTPVVPR